MARGNGKNPLSHDVSQETLDTFDKICDEIGPPKYRVLEAAIEVFASLPRELQYALRGNNAADRKLCLDLIAGLLLPREQSPPSPSASRSKSR